MSPVVLERDHQGLGVSSPRVTEATVRKMGGYIREAQSDPLLAHSLKDALKATAQGPSSLACIWWWIKHRVKFLHHDPQICKLLNECNGGEFQLLITPPVLLRMKNPEGDCATFTMLALAMAMLAGYRVRIVTLACDRRRPGEYSHVYGSVLSVGRRTEQSLPDEDWRPFDVSHGKYPGWEVPLYEQQRKTVWDLDANVISDRWQRVA